MDNGIVEIHTDAAYFNGIGFYCFIIFYKGDKIIKSGVINEKCIGSFDAECYAILYSLRKLYCITNDDKIDRIVFYRDNKTAVARKKGNKLQKILYENVKWWHEYRSKNDRTLNEFYSFVHVKSHIKTTNKFYSHKRHEINRECDTQCRLQIKIWKQKHSPALAADAAAK